MRDQTSRRRFVGAVGATVAAAALAGCSGGGGSTPTDEPEPTTTAPDDGNGGDTWVETSTVEMTDELTYEPERIQVSAGTTVTWENVGAVGHTVTAYEDEIPEGATYFASGGFDTEEAARDGYPDEGNITEGGTYEHTFETKGEYKYYCIPHEMNGMIGYVKVI